MRRFGISRAGLLVLAIASGIVLCGSVLSRPKAAVLNQTGNIQGRAACAIPASAPQAGRRAASDPGLASRDYRVLMQGHITSHRLAGGRPGSSADPVPIPGGLFGGAFHVWVPGPTELGLMGLNVESNVITNFNGFAAIAFFVGTAHGSDGIDYDMMDDMRVYRGNYISDDGTHHHGTFVFV